MQELDMVYTILGVLYIVAITVIAFNLVMIAAYVGAKIGDRPDWVGEYIGSSVDISGGSHT